MNYTAKVTRVLYRQDDELTRKLINAYANVRWLESEKRDRKHEVRMTFDAMVRRVLDTNQVVIVQVLKDEDDNQLLRFIEFDIVNEGHVYEIASLDVQDGLPNVGVLEVKD